MKSLWKWRQQAENSALKMMNSVWKMMNSVCVKRRRILRCGWWAWLRGTQKWHVLLRIYIEMAAFATANSGKNAAISIEIRSMLAPPHDFHCLPLVLFYFDEHHFDWFALKHMAEQSKSAPSPLSRINLLWAILSAFVFISRPSFSRLWSILLPVCDPFCSKLTQRLLYVSSLVRDSPGVIAKKIKKAKTDMVRFLTFKMTISYLTWWLIPTK